MFYEKMNALPKPRIAEVLPPPGEYPDALEKMFRRRRTLARDLGLVEAQIEHLLASHCPNVAQDVELYNGNLGVSRKFVDDYEGPVGQLQWLDDLEERFNRPEDHPGDVSGERWGTGALIADDIFLTAGHCFDQYPRGWVVPSQFNVPISPTHIAKLMQVNFNYQVDGRTKKTRPGVPFPVTGLLEYRNGDIDYAILKLGPNQEGKLPGKLFGSLALAKKDLRKVGTMLCIIQHPIRREKKIEAGPLKEIRAGRIAYDSIDTAGGSSGAPILSPKGEIVGVHLKGGCTGEAGFNSGCTIGAIRAASQLLG